ncbi:MAG: glycosyltransferase [candidate division Zixibacteria bacterium]|nr:glycosyltransferase [candidate division Zixibacteria bacterium]
MNPPLLSIIMIVYNSELYIAEAIESILNQTCKDFEFIIIDDGSTDNSIKIIKSYSDSRIRFLSNKTNRGIVYSRNRGLEEAKGEFVGMFDSDDVAYRSKFEEQINFLNSHQDYGMIGSWVEWIDENGNNSGKGWKLDAASEYIPAIMLFRNYFVQSAVLYRSECISGRRFQEGLEIGEDYQLWLDICQLHKVWNLPKYLVKYRIHLQSTTSNKSALKRYDKNLFTGLFEQLGIEASDEEIELHIMLRYDATIRSGRILIGISNWLEKIIVQNKTSKVYNHAILTKVAFNRWLKSCYMARSMVFKTAFIFVTSRILRLYLVSVIKSLGRS